MLAPIEAIAKRMLGPRIEPEGLRSACVQAGVALAASRVIAWGAALLGGHGHLAAAFERWDSFHYLAIAQHGYPPHGDQLWAFYPLYPLLARTVSIGVALSIASFWLALVLIHVLAEGEVGRTAARRAIWIAAFFPASFFFTAYYTEGLFLLLSTGAFLAARRGRPGIAAVLGFDAVLTRGVGIALAVPLLLLGRRSVRTRALAAAGPVLGFVTFLLVAYVRTGDALAPIHAERTWGRAFHGPFAAVLSGARDAVEALGGGAHPTWTFEPGWMRALQFGLLVLAALAVIGLLRRFPAAYGLYVLAALAVPLSGFWSDHPLVSFSRYMAALFPIYIWLGAIVRGRRLPAVLVIEASCLALLSWRFGAGMWAG